MRMFIVFSALVALAVASPLHKSVYTSTQLQEIIDAIHSPNTDPTTAVKLIDMLLEVTGAQQPDISPAFVEDDIQNEPPFAGHEVAPSAPSPLVQIIINVKQPSPGATPADVDGESGSNVSDEIDGVQVQDLPEELSPVEVAEDLPEPPPVSPIIVANDLPAPPVSSVIVADYLPAPPSTGIVVANDLPAPPSTGIVIANDLPAPPSSGVVVANLPTLANFHY